MGSFSPVDWVSDDLIAETEQRVVQPMLDLMAAKGINYRGVLFSGLMYDAGRLNCLEYNVRFGDPEIQSVVCRLGIGFTDALYAVATGKPVPPLEVIQNTAVTVVMASGGYPGSYEKGKPIQIGKVGNGVKVFHSGTAVRGGAVVTNGGRVLSVSAVGRSVPEARASAYAGVAQIGFDGSQFRTDIAADSS